MASGGGGPGVWAFSSEHSKQKMEYGGHPLASVRVSWRFDLWWWRSSRREIGLARWPCGESPFGDIGGSVVGAGQAYIYGELHLLYRFCQVWRRVWDVIPV